MDIRVEADLPPLAWVVDCEGAEIRARCGTAVVLSEHGLFEGCWSGDFQAFDFDRDDFVFGAGMRLRDGRPVFVPPHHTLEALFAWTWRDGYSVSNSLAFLCEHRRIDLPYARYGGRFASIVLGIDTYRKKIHETGAGTLYRIVYDRFSIDGGEIHLSRLPAKTQFTDFASYRSTLVDVVSRAAGNANHPDRKQRYDLLSTVSTGYDSAAGAALASEIGCRRAITFKRDRAGDVDSGIDVGARLDIEVEEFQGHSQDWEPSSPVEAEFCATGLGGEDILFIQAENTLRHSLLITGFHGDAVWDLHKAAGTSIERGDISGSSLSEFRLRVNFIHLPIPFIGSRHWPQIKLISGSEEMLPYRIGGTYDRPIPRRILEEAGVERTCFGQRKKAVSTLLFSDRMRLSSATLDDISRRQSALVDGRRLQFYLHRVQFFAQRAANKLAREFFAKLLGLRTIYKLLEGALIGDYRVFEHSHPRHTDMVFLWALEKQRRKYRTENRSASRVE